MDWEFELVAGPYDFPLDGPAWDGEALLFSRLALPPGGIENAILRYDPQSGQVASYRRWTNRVSGLAFSAEGILYGCQSGSRRVIRFNPDGSASPLCYKLDGQYHNQPKDLVVDSQGRIWFTDPVWGPPVQGGLSYHELEPYSVRHSSVLRMGSPPSLDSHLHRMTYDTQVPLGILLSQDERTLYVSESSDEPEGKRELRAYPILDEGSLGPFDLIHSFGADYPGVHRGISGMCLDTEGNIFACAGSKGSGPGPMVYVLSDAGRVLETHPAPSEPTNCTFGGPDLGTLYITTTEGQLYRVRNTGHKGWLLHPKPR